MQVRLYNNGFELYQDANNIKSIPAGNGFLELVNGIILFYNERQDFKIENINEIESITDFSGDTPVEVDVPEDLAGLFVILRPFFFRKRVSVSGFEPAITGGTSLQYWRGDKTFQILDKSAVGLGNIDNTSDLNKPISNLTQAALNIKGGRLNNFGNALFVNSFGASPTNSATRSQAIGNEDVYFSNLAAANAQANDNDSIIVIGSGGNATITKTGINIFLFDRLASIGNITFNRSGSGGFLYINGFGTVGNVNLTNNGEIVYLDSCISVGTIFTNNSHASMTAVLTDVKTVGNIQVGTVEAENCRQIGAITGANIKLTNIKYVSGILQPFASSFGAGQAFNLKANLVNFKVASGSNIFWDDRNVVRYIQALNCTFYTPNDSNIRMTDCNADKITLSDCILRSGTAAGDYAIEINTSLGVNTYLVLENILKNKGYSQVGGLGFQYDVQINDNPPVNETFLDRLIPN